MGLMMQGCKASALLHLPSVACISSPPLKRASITFGHLILHHRPWTGEAPYASLCQSGPSSSSAVGDSCASSSASVVTPLYTCSLFSSDSHFKCLNQRLTTALLSTTDHLLSISSTSVFFSALMILLSKGLRTQTVSSATVHCSTVRLSMSPW